MLDGDLWTASLCHSFSPGCCSLIRMSCWAVPRPCRSTLWLFYRPDNSMKLVLQSLWLSGLKSIELSRVLRYVAPTNPMRPGCLIGFLRFKYQLLHIEESFYPSQKMEHILLGLKTATARMLNPLNKPEDSGKKSAVFQTSPDLPRLIALNRNWSPPWEPDCPSFARETTLLPGWCLWYYTVAQARCCLAGRSSAFEAWANLPAEQGLVIFSEHPFKALAWPQPAGSWRTNAGWTLAAMGGIILL